MKIIIGLAGIVIGILLVVKSYFLTSTFGQISFAEKYLGSGGTYTFYKLLGIAFIVLSVLYMFDVWHFSVPIPQTGP
ncbi:MAG: hypothetical protein A3C85_03055 [Candidatus Doudnabacteria bacterium RIFCSPHIGHO2_02_FULL_48_21]|uniref:Uncharacterized protein n=1 Tax=Candidatus Doudnabacteria bacterium RIFCSPLOWO2_02_FULL_48_13 TaxID=1817845 RepID=A0A1F5QCW6_9BACT|nr:MAG: hypothetical protein A3K05_00315 [Candidatus Doudnabacteria bacterium RIFCSPHIGHO2_01_48_18]OGE77084.1 MAG: hypothetical protein A2668_02425 [Candidatus Doudnabacteria bacterium RIFCSPHIGHO2_01_FULL_48_180]OGE91625.1 MAG: hypothetical protein A3F44_02885 [Candidatus Doudnabacteria bacterium RIFCSPHIGHO2_12_FULL_47_25]OGE93239.1 MAG: hypothetical protein A3C85_03055 [Candidatus Doudnabacteria bacterium RIFCSPHIGHO2_02_FULL_48_21]OGE96362.1 MAG: hypothetical protein A3A83_01300 [Candidatu